jgi:hypothetical protein
MKSKLIRELKEAQKITDKYQIDVSFEAESMNLDGYYEACCFHYRQRNGTTTYGKEMVKNVKITDKDYIICKLQAENKRLRESLEEADNKFDYTSPEITHRILKQALKETK